MAPLRTLLASLLLATAALAPATVAADDIDPTTLAITKSSSSSIPDRKSIETVYASTQSAAGFMFDIKSKSSIVIYGLDVNAGPPPVSNGGPTMNVKIYTKEGTLKGSEYKEDDWDLWIDTTIEGKGLDEATPIPQLAEAASTYEPLLVPAKGKRSFYVTFDGPYLRYSDNMDKLYYINQDAFIYGGGVAKREGWNGSILASRTFNGALHYYTSDSVLDLNGVELLPAMIVSDEPTNSPVESPTISPTLSHMPTISSKPTEEPTVKPTGNPTRKPTRNPTASPISFDRFSTRFEDASTKPVLVYAGMMFDLKGRNDIEISSIGFNTYKTDSINMQLYIRDGSYKGYENDLSAWTHVNNVTVVGQGMGQPTYLPQKSFEPFLLRKQKRMGIYLTTDGPYLRATKGDVEGKPHAANPDLVLYQGVGKRYPINTGTVAARIFNGAFGYLPVDIPSPSPTINAEDLFVRNYTFIPTDDTFIQKNAASTNFGDRAQLMVDGQPDKVSLIKFDVSILNGNTINEPEQILSAVLRLYSMSGSDFGGYVSVIPNGDIDEDSTTWDNVDYGEEETGTPIGEFRSIWPDKFYEMDITEAFRTGTIPQSVLIRIASDDGNGVIYRSRDGNSWNGPRLIVKFAYEPDTTPLLAQMFGSDPPTMAPTIKPEWDDAIVPPNPSRTYFNYDPRSGYGPDRWNRIWPDTYYDNLKRLRTDTRRNRCMDGRRQSPRNLCQTGDKCLEYHETRLRAGQYGLAAGNETKARPTPLIQHNKLRLVYKERRSEHEEPIPPGADFAQNGLNSGIQDLVNIDIKVRSEHRLCGKQYDAEMQLYYVHAEGNLEATSILVNADGEHNAYFQIMIDFFQQKFDGDARSCQRRQRRARALFENRNGDKAQPTKLRGSSSSSSAAIAAGTMNDEGHGEIYDDVDEEPASSLGSILYQKIHDRFLSLIQRREAGELRWDPLKPWDIYKSVHFWSYSGSTTEPPCFEDVKWRVTDVPMTISSKQYVQLKRIMFDHVDPDTCRKTSSHYDESNARPVQPYKGGATYRCRRSDYASDVERGASGRVKGFVLRQKWWGVDNLPYVDPEFPEV